MTHVFEIEPLDYFQTTNQKIKVMCTANASRVCRSKTNKQKVMLSFLLFQMEN